MNMKDVGKKAVVPITSAIIGGLVVLAALKLNPTVSSKAESHLDRGQREDQIYDDIFNKQEGIRHQFDSLFNDDFIAQNDPFKEMKRMRRQMEKRLGARDHHSGAKSNPFDSWFSDKFGGGSIDDISKREDDGFVYYDIKVSDANTASINTKVEKGYVTISGTVEEKSGSDGKDDGFSAQSILKSSFNRTFPLPENVDQDKMQMLTEKDKVECGHWTGVDKSINLKQVSRLPIIEWEPDYAEETLSIYRRSEETRG